ncbi:MAG: hypothetical protein ABIJ75_10630 [Actinomycetota bacterium]
MTYDLYRSPRPHPDPDTEGLKINTYRILIEAVDRARMLGGWHWITRSGASGLYRDAVELVAPRAQVPEAFLADLEALRLMDEVN